MIESLNPRGVKPKSKSKPNPNLYIKFNGNVYAEILNILRRNGGVAKDIKIYEVIAEIYGISYSEFIRKLMVLELRGFITVTKVRNKHSYYIIRLIKKKR